MNDIIIQKANKHQTMDLKQVAEIISTFWSKDIYISPYTSLELIKSYCNKNDFPFTLIAKEKREVIGFISLITNNSFLRQDLSPVIGLIYVKPEYRNKKIGSNLVNSLLEIAKLNFEKIYVLTDIKGFYETLGFKFIEVTNSDINRSKDLIILKRLYVYNFRSEK